MLTLRVARYVAFLAVAAVAATTYGAGTGSLAAAAVGDDGAKAKEAVAELRAMGPAGLDVLFDANAATLAAHAQDPAKDARDPAWLRLKGAIDQVAGQKDAYASHLFWYTDFAAAQKAAEAEHKPILTLRMLGKLTDDLSCANSRFFRTTLYANADVSAYLREHFILEWESVRPVPRITIDMGDGRKFERTITGNSIHYVLDVKGRVVDGIPGLYGAKTFLATLTAAEQEAAAVGALGDGAFQAAVKQYHAAAAEGTRAALRADQAKAYPETLVAQPMALPATGAFTMMTSGATITLSGASAPLTTIQPMGVPAGAGIAGAGITMPGAIPGGATGPTVIFFSPAPAGSALTLSGAPGTLATGGSTFPAAPAAMRLTTGKSTVETPMLRAMTFAPATAPVPAVPAAKDSAEDWSKIGALHADTAAVDAHVKALMIDKNPAIAANEATTLKRDVESPLLRMVRNVESAIAADTARNENTFHVSIHEWLAAAKAPVNLKAFNERVYAELFLTPSSDPWLGLVPPDTFSALDNEGLCPMDAGK